MLGCQARSAISHGSRAHCDSMSMQRQLDLETLQTSHICATHMHTNTNLVGSVTCAALQVHDEHQELTPDTVLTHFMFSLPSEECPTFSTHLIQHTWLLRFEFTTVYQPQSSGWGLSKAKAPETVSWLLPILVAPPSK